MEKQTKQNLKKTYDIFITIVFLGGCIIGLYYLSTKYFGFPLGKTLMIMVPITIITGIMAVVGLRAGFERYYKKDHGEPLGLSTHFNKSEFVKILIYSVAVLLLCFGGIRILYTQTLPAIGWSLFVVGIFFAVLLVRKMREITKKNNLDKG